MRSRIVTNPAAIATAGKTGNKKRGFSVRNALKKPRIVSSSLAYEHVSSASGGLTSIHTLGVMP